MLIMFAILKSFGGCWISNIMSLRTDFPNIFSLKAYQNQCIKKWNALHLLTILHTVKTTFI